MQKKAIEEQTKNSTEIARVLTFLGAIFLPANLLANIVGISKENVGTGKDWGYWMIGVFAGPPLLFGLIMLYVNWRENRQKRKNQEVNDEEQQMTASEARKALIVALSRDLW